MVSAIRQASRRSSWKSSSRIPNAELEQATETLRTLKETLLEILGADAEDGESADIDTLS